MEDFSAGTVRFIGVAELLGAVGLIPPAATGIAPVLTPIAATCLAVLMVLAAATHIRRKEPSGVAFTAVLLVLAVVVAWGWLASPTTSRSTWPSQRWTCMPSYIQLGR